MLGVEKLVVLFVEHSQLSNCSKFSCVVFCTNFSVNYLCIVLLSSQKNFKVKFLVEIFT